MAGEPARRYARAMDHLARPAALALLLALTPGCAMFQGVKPEPWRPGLVVHWGERDLDEEDELARLDDQQTYGVAWDAYQLNATLGLEAALFHSQEDDDSPAGSSEITTTELSFGARRTWQPNDLGVHWIHPYLGAGLALLYSDVTLPGGGDDDFDVGAYFHVGFYAQFPMRWRFGVDWRFLREDWLDSGGVDVDSDQVTAFLGYAF
jgi:hypothetical protein